MRTLVATDLSDAADEALRQAAALAGPSGALAAIHVLPSLHSVASLFPQRHAADGFDVARVHLQAVDALRQRVSRECGRHADIFVTEGADSTEIVRRAEAWHADTIVVGSHGQGGLSRVLGSVAERVVRNAPCRVLVARARPASARGGVLAATDLSEPALPAVTAAAAEARRRGVGLKVAHAVGFLQSESLYLFERRSPLTYLVDDLHDPAHNRLRTLMRKAGVDAEDLILDGLAANAVVRCAGESGAELVVVGASGRAGLKRLVVGSVAEKIVRSAPCSVLVVRMDA